MQHTLHASSATMYDDGTYLEKNPTWHEEDSPWKAAQVLQMLSRNGLFPALICEVGCGAGRILAEVAARTQAVRAVGYEVSPQALSLCANKARPGLEFRLADILETDDFYDLLLAIDVFEHIEDYLGFLRRLKRHAKLTMFHVPLDISAQTVARGKPLRNLRENVGHLHHFTKDTALSTLRVTGYTVRDWFYTYGSLNGPRRSRMAKVAAMPRRIARMVNQDVAVRLFGGCSLMVLCE